MPWGQAQGKRGQREEEAFESCVGRPVLSEIIAAFGAWRSLVARTVRVGEVPGSNPGAPICLPPVDSTACAVRAGSFGDGFDPPLDLGEGWAVLQGPRPPRAADDRRLAGADPELAAEFVVALQPPPDLAVG